jgi:hypothetical protein
MCKRRYNSSAEVTIQDVVNSEDINIYRELLVALLLHNYYMVLQTYRWTTIVKWKWGQDAMKCFIKPT